MCSFTTVPSWVDITFSYIIQKADKEGNAVGTEKPFLLVHNFLAVFIQTCSAGEPIYVSAADMSPVLNSVCRKRQNKWAQNAWMTCIPPGESQLKLFLQVLETFSGIDMLMWSRSVRRLTTVMNWPSISDWILILRAQRKNVFCHYYNAIFKYDL